jgi:hypothetical protein
MLCSIQAFASHPHDSICVVKGKTKSAESISLFLQIQSEREYVNGDPNQDIHDWTYQARICDDDNDSTSCSTFKNAKITHDISEEFTLVGMVNSSKVFFTGKTVDGNKLIGKMTVDNQKEDFTGNMTCISQSWIELKAEADSNVY